MLLSVLTLLLACRPTPTDTGPVADLGVLHALRGAGTVVFTDQDLPEGAVVQRQGVEGWEDLASRGRAWWDGATEGGYRLAEPDAERWGPTVLPQALEISLASQAAPGPFYEGALVDLSLESSAVDAWPGLSLSLSRTRGDETAWWDGAAWSQDPRSFLEVADPASPVSLPALSADAPDPTLTEAAVAWTFRDGSVDREVARSSLPVVELGRTLAWGDLHAHSNLSQDGCEDPDADCANRSHEPGGDFFEQAWKAGLQFAAMTEHAEYVRLHPEGDPDGDGVDLWAAALARVDEARGAYPGFIPLLGFEWTYASAVEEGGVRYGGHRNVIFEAPEACESWRVASSIDAVPYVNPANGNVYEWGNPVVAGVPNQLYVRLDEADQVCPSDRVMVIPHHTAMEVPQPMDWNWEQNAPHSTYMALAEIHSEHGSSECRDDTLPGCEWHPKESGGYFGAGGMQTALENGFLIGFAGGTDGHDGKPGTLDQPSCTAHETDSDGDGVTESVHCHVWNGSVTGALVRGDLAAMEDSDGRKALFDALFSRNTLVTSGPLSPLAVAGLGADGKVYLPGDAVPAAASPLHLVISCGDLDSGGSTLLGLQVLDESGTTLVESLEPDLETDVDLAPGNAIYIRVRVSWNGAEERLWSSPFFGT